MFSLVYQQQNFYCWIPWMIMYVNWLDYVLSGKTLILLSSLLFYSLWIFYISTYWRFFTGIWVTASLFSSPELFKVFLLILTVLWSGWSWFFLWSWVPPVTFPGPRGSFQVHILQLVSPTPCFTVFSALWGKKILYPLFAFFYFQSYGQLERKSIGWQVIFFLLIITMFDLLARIGWSVCIPVNLFWSQDDKLFSC